MTIKRLEFDVVLLGDDFPTVVDLVQDIVLHKPSWLNLNYFVRNKMLEINKDNLRNFFRYLVEDKSIQMNTIKEEINLFYVAVTRAKKVLKLENCYIIDPKEIEILFNVDD